MSTKRSKLEEVSPEVRASNAQGQKLNEARHAAQEDYRRKQSTPTSPAEHTDRIARLAKGEVVEPSIDDAAAKRAAAYLCHDLEEACELHHKQFPIKHRALGELAKTLLPEERSTLKRMAAGLVEAHLANRDFLELKDYLIGEGGLVGICLTDTERVLGHPNDRVSDLAILLRELVAVGALDKLPVGLA